jgi:tRNA threonylcarbamoyl adenosine modification protein YeaZ
LILAVIDTSTRFAGVGAMDDAGNRSTRAWRSNQNHGRELMPALIECLDELSLAPTDITHVAVALGPGGFSAVRVGISATLGLVVAKQLPVLGIPTHDIEVEPHRAQIATDRPVYSLLPAGRNELSWARHGANADRETGMSAPDVFVEGLESGALLCGEACDLVVGLVERSRFAEPATSGAGESAGTRDPNSIIDIARASFGAGGTTPYEELRPIYARPPSISTPKPPR